MNLEGIIKALDSIPLPSDSMRRSPLMKKPTSKCSLPYLMEEIKKDLNIGFSLEDLNDLKYTPFNIFINLPLNQEIYQKMVLLSPKPEDVLKASEIMEVPLIGSVNLDISISLPFPALTPTPRTSDVIEYVQKINDYFMTLLKTREQQYSAYFHNLCLCYVKYLKKSAQSSMKVVQVSKGHKLEATESERQKVLREVILQKIELSYYKNIKHMLMIIVLEMVRKVIMEVSTTVSSVQCNHESIFQRLTYVWESRTHSHSLFQPLVCHMGPALINHKDGMKPVIEEDMISINLIRQTLGLPYVVFKLVGSNNCIPTYNDSLKQVVKDRDRSQQILWEFLSKFVCGKITAYSDVNVNPNLEDHLYAVVTGKIKSSTYGISIPRVVTQKCEAEDISMAEEDCTPEKCLIPKIIVSEEPQASDDYFKSLNCLLGLVTDE